MLNNGPGCHINEEVTSSAECAKAVRQLGYTGAVQIGTWSHAPKGCFVGHDNDNWSHTFFNSFTGATGHHYYRSICKTQSKGWK